MMKLTLAFLACAALLAIEAAAQQSMKKPSDEEVKELKGKCKATIIKRSRQKEPQSLAFAEGEEYKNTPL